MKKHILAVMPKNPLEANFVPAQRCQTAGCAATSPRSVFQGVSEQPLLEWTYSCNFHFDALTFLENFGTALDMSFEDI